MKPVDKKFAGEKMWCKEEKKKLESFIIITIKGKSFFVIYLLSSAFKGLGNDTVIIWDLRYGACYRYLRLNIFVFLSLTVA